MRYEIDTRYQDISRRKEQAEQTRVFITTVGKDISEQVSKKQSREVTAALTTANGLLNKLQVKPEFLDASNPAEWERGALVLGMSTMWNSSSQDLFTSHRDIANWLSVLYEPAQRNAVMSQPQDFSPYTDDEIIMGEVFQRTWGERDFAWIAANRAEDGLVQLPYYAKRTGEGNKLYCEVLQEIFIETGMLGCNILGEAFPDRNMAVVLADADNLTIAHERAHLVNQNLYVADFGMGLNEGKTERVAREQYPEQAVFDDVYAEEVVLFDTLVRRDPVMETLIDDRYRTLTKETALGLASGLIERYGLYKYMMIYAAHPSAISEEEYCIGSRTDEDEQWLFKNTFGYLNTDDVSKRLRRKWF